MDHVYSGAHLRHYRYPKTFLLDEEILSFGDGLREIIHDKLGELLETMTNLQTVRQNCLKILSKHHLGGLAQWFWAYWIEIDFAEYEVAQKWLQYWLKLAQVVDKTEPHVQPKGNGVTDGEILQAKQFPLGQLYQGQLRKTANRLVGLCPFHEEKSPSFVIYEDQNRFHCFGCGVDGDSIDLAMKQKDCDMVSAVRNLL